MSEKLLSLFGYCALPENFSGSTGEALILMGKYLIRREKDGKSVNGRNPWDNDRSTKDTIDAIYSEFRDSVAKGNKLLGYFEVSEWKNNKWNLVKGATMKLSKLQEIAGVLVTAGRTDLAEEISGFGGKGKRGGRGKRPGKGKKKMKRNRSGPHGRGMGPGGGRQDGSGLK